jgi:CBS domain-containing protein
MEPAMKVADILRIKGSVVKTVPPHETALLLSGQMRAEQIGALVVSSDGNSIEGIVSERDLAYGLATYGGRLPTIPVSQLMTKAVAICSPDDSVTDVMKLMTIRRIRMCLSRMAINSWGSSASVMCLSTDLESYR